MLAAPRRPRARRGGLLSSNACQIGSSGECFCGIRLQHRPLADGERRPGRCRKHSARRPAAGSGSGGCPELARRHRRVVRPLRRKRRARIGRVVALGDRDADGPGHVRVGDVEEALGQLGRSEIRPLGAATIRSQSDSSLFRPPDRGETESDPAEASQEKIDVGDGQRSAATVARPARDRRRHWPGQRQASRRRSRRCFRRRPRRFRRPASARRSARPPFASRIPARNCRQIGRRRCWCLPCRSRSTAGTRRMRHAGKADHAAGRAGQDAVLADEAAASTSPPAEVISLSCPGAERPQQPLDVGPQHRIQIGVDDRRIAPGNNLDQRCKSAGRLISTKPTSPAIARQMLVGRIGERMQQADRQRVDALGPQVLQQARISSAAGARSTLPGRRSARRFRRRRRTAASACGSPDRTAAAGPDSRSAAHRRSRAW